MHEIHSFSTKLDDFVFQKIQVLSQNNILRIQIILDNDLLIFNHSSTTIPLKIGYDAIFSQSKSQIDELPMKLSNIFLIKIPNNLRKSQLNTLIEEINIIILILNKSYGNKINKR